MTVPAVRIDQLSYRYRGRSGAIVEALREIIFDVLPGEFISVVGPSGVGKSTLLQIISNLITPDTGSVQFPAFASRPRIGYLFQSNAVFPWRSVEKNLTYAMEIHGESRKRRCERAEELCRFVGLNPETYLCKYPHELSGGEVRRVGLGMAMAITPDLLLLDEPTSAVDWFARRQLQSLVQEVITRAKSTAIVVTHDVEEAVWLSNRILVLHHGKVANSIEVNLPRPRTDEMRTTPEFKLFEDEVITSLTLK